MPIRTLPEACSWSVSPSRKTFGGGKAAIGLLLFAMTAAGFYSAFTCKTRGAIVGAPLGNGRLRILRAHTPLVWLEILLVVQGLSICTVTAAVMAILP